MKIATWNINSLTVRLPQVLDWLAAQPADAPVDVLALQELKLTDDKFPAAAFQEAGYHAQWFGQKTYNGVALITRAPVTRRGEEHPRLCGRHGARDHAPTAGGGVRVIGAYFPNGQAPGRDKFVYKMRWLKALREWVRAELVEHTRIWCCWATTTSPSTTSTCGTRWAWQAPSTAPTKSARTCRP